MASKPKLLNVSLAIFLSSLQVTAGLIEVQVIKNNMSDENFFR